MRGTISENMFIYIYYNVHAGIKYAVMEKKNAKMIFFKRRRVGLKVSQYRCFGVQVVELAPVLLSAS